MLRRRLDRALELLEENPQVVCILSGGQGAGRGLHQALVMEKYLWIRGVDSRRLYREERSTSTAENLRFSAQIQGKRLPDRPSPPTAFTSSVLPFWPGGRLFPAVRPLPPAPWGLVPCYWGQEWFGLVKGTWSFHNGGRYKFCNFQRKERRPWTDGTDGWIGYILPALLIAAAAPDLGAVRSAVPAFGLFPSSAEDGGQGGQGLPPLRRLSLWTTPVRALTAGTIRPANSGFLSRNGVH